uniref:hypothetical protein n=1 Tax=Gluconobacter thailandicus TaxID=257438 RepID=UPI0018D35086|nr:hypothetical protein [Gluconobacter thailandicus]
MTVSLKTQKILWGRAAARCSMPECRRQLVEDISETDDPTLVGENCHIVAEKDGGPRSDPTMSVDDRNRYANLTLLCNVHHKIIDDNEAVWTVDRLKDLKAEHETWVEQSLGLDKAKMRDDTVYAGYVDEWVKLAHLDEWLAWSGWVLEFGQPRIRVNIYDDLTALNRWLLGRVWPGRYPSLETAFGNFRRVLADFKEILQEHLQPHGAGAELWTKKFYKIRQWDRSLYAELLARYEFHVGLVSDLMLELTRAANLVCDEIRRHLAHNFRLAEGHLIVQCGEELVPRYSPTEAAAPMSYPGLRQFYDERSTRDFTIGKGQPKA